MRTFILILAVCVIIQHLEIGWWIISITGLWFYRQHLINKSIIQRRKDIFYGDQ